MVSDDRSKTTQILTILRRRFNNIYCRLQDLCMKYKRNVKHNGTIKYLGERIRVCECVHVYVCIIVYAVSYTHLDVYKRQV